MAITVKHKFVSAIPDGTDATVVRPSNWNDDHDLTGTIPVANGGTGVSTLTGIVVGNGTSAMTDSATVPWSDISNQPHIEAYDASASIALTATPTLLKPASTIAGSSGITYDAATGVFTFANEGSYSLSLNVNAKSTAANQFVYIYAEQDVGAGWVVNTNSGKTYELTNANIVQIVYSQAVYRVAGQKVRYYIYSNSNKVSLDTVALPGGGGSRTPAIRIQYS